MNLIKKKIDKTTKRINEILASENEDLTELTYLISKRKDLESNPFYFMENKPDLTNGKISLYLKKENKFSNCELHYLIFNNETQEQLGYILFLGKNNRFCGGEYFLFYRN